MLLALLIILYITILLMELPFLFKNKMYREMLIFFIIFALGVFLSVAKFKGKLLFNPLEPLFYIYKLKI